MASPLPAEISLEQFDGLIHAHEVYQNLFEECEPKLVEAAHALKQLFVQRLLPNLKDVQTYSAPYRWLTYGNKIEILIDSGTVWAEYLEADGEIVAAYEITHDLLTEAGRQKFVEKQIETIHQINLSKDVDTCVQQLDYHERQIAQLQATLKTLQSS